MPLYSLSVIIDQGWAAEPLGLPRSPGFLPVMTDIAALRRQLVSLARSYREGKSSYAEFVDGVFRLDDYRKEPYAMALLDLVEHEPAVGGLLGVTAAEHAAYIAEIEETLDELLAEPWVSDDRTPGV